MKKEIISVGGRSWGKSLVREAIEDLIKTQERFRRVGVTFTKEQKDQIKNYSKNKP